jgi:hypothetical protein
LEAGALKQFPAVAPNVRCRQVVRQFEITERQRNLSPYEARWLLRRGVAFGAPECADDGFAQRVVKVCMAG